MAPPAEPETEELRAALEPYRARYRTTVHVEGGTAVEEDPDIDQRAFTALCIDYAKAFPSVNFDSVREAVRFRRA